MTTEVDTAVSAIDAAIGDPGCRRCSQPVAGSPSADFCSEDCQQTWQDRPRSVDPRDRASPTVGLVGAATRGGRATRTRSA
jgi:hypothetical protein